MSQVQLSVETLLAELDKANIENGRLRLINAQLMEMLSEDEAEPEENEDGEP